MIGFVSLGSGEFVRRGFEGCCSIVLSRLLLTPCWCFCSLPCVDSSAPRSRLQRCWYQFKWVWLQLRASATNNRGHQVQIPKITANLWFKISYADLCHSGDSSSSGNFGFVLYWPFVVSILQKWFSVTFVSLVLGRMKILKSAFIPWNNFDMSRKPWKWININNIATKYLVCDQRPLREMSLMCVCKKCIFDINFASESDKYAEITFKVLYIYNI